MKFLAVAFVALFAFLPQANAQVVSKDIIIEGLNSPTGITLDIWGNLYFTEVPSPGVAGADNTVNRYRLYNGNRSVISEGEPYPTNLAVNYRGTLYWTCQTAGVILKAPNFGRDEKSVAFDGLADPVGLDVPLFGARAGDEILFTEVPDPGNFGTTNKVNLGVKFRKNRQLVVPVADTIIPLSAGEPEPVDVAVSFAGEVYWTCKTAGVILKRDRNGDVAPVLEGLQSPTGLDLDYKGRIYFTEVPEPGVMGGANKVSRYDPQTGAMCVISEGEPEPVDVTTSLNGRRVYWTCKTAGVIIRAKLSN